MKSTFIYISIIISLAFVSGKLGYKLYQEHRDTVRLTDNLKAIQEENVYFKAKNGDQAVRIQSQELTIQELKKTIPKAIADIKNLYIQPRQLISYTGTKAEIEKHIITTIRDSIIIDTVKVSVIDYFDEWFTIVGTIEADTAKLDIRTRDKITVINYMSRRPHPWLWIFGGRRRPECAISNQNPFNRITIEKSISIKK